MNAAWTAKEPAWVRPICRAFPGIPEQAPYVRDFVARRLRSYSCPEEAIHDIVLCADELAVNAIKHTTSGRPGGRFLVTVRLTEQLAEQTVRVEVTDDGPVDNPVQAQDDEFGDGGRGLFLIAALARWSGYEVTRFGGLAWFEYAFTPAR